MSNNVLLTDMLNKQSLYNIDIYQNNIKNLSKVQQDTNILQDNHVFQKDIDDVQDTINLQNLENVNKNDSILLDFIKNKINLMLLKKYNIIDDIHTTDINSISNDHHQNNINNNNILLKKKFFITPHHMIVIHK